MLKKIFNRIHDDAHSHSHGDITHTHDEHHGHTHGVIDPTIATTDRGIWAIKWSFVGLMLTAVFQVVVVWLSGSVALLADTIHNFADAATAVPLWIAFTLARWKPNKKFTYGYGRAEDLAGISIVVIIALSAVFAGYEAVQRLINPQPVDYVWAVIAASIIGFLGNEAVALFRIKVGKEINSAALIADGYHARVDGLTSLAVLFGAVGVWLGYPLADPIVGLIITVAIVQIVWQSSKAVFTRALDGVDPDIIDKISDTVTHTPGVKSVTGIRARWIGHRLHAELNTAVASKLSVVEAHAIAKEVRHQLLHCLSFLSSVIVHIDPAEESGDA
ncbi:MAG TPA: cation diffusion facilitator family transporter, partial [Gammaproteobacteria bacterium]|nr:cation diffusion facilitator family transporter [Gammaproteobacteria bacterium]